MHVEWFNLQLFRVRVVFRLSHTFFGGFSAYRKLVGWAANDSSLPVYYLVVFLVHHRACWLH